MNQELQKALAEWLQSMLTAAQNAAGQIPPMLWEKVLWGRIVLTTATVVVFLLAVGVPLGMLRAARRLPQVGQYDSQVPAATCMRLWAFAPACVGGVLTFLLFASALEAWIAPHVYLMNWIRALIPR
jgi:hypothetical protein